MKYIHVSSTIQRISSILLLVPMLVLSQESSNKSQLILGKWSLSALTHNELDRFGGCDAEESLVFSNDGSLLSKGQPYDKPCSFLTTENTYHFEGHDLVITYPEELFKGTPLFYKFKILVLDKTTLKITPYFSSEDGLFPENIKVVTTFTKQSL